MKSQPLQLRSTSPANELARRFERDCRRLVDCRVDAVVTQDGGGLELRVAPAGRGVEESLSVSGLDGDSWTDRRGMESLAQVISVWSEPSGQAVVKKVPQQPRPRFAVHARPSQPTTWLHRLASPVSNPSAKISPS